MNQDHVHPAVVPPLHTLDRMRKRLFDLAFALLLLGLTSPLFLLIALLIRRGSAGRIFYRQLRVGRHKQPFYIYKFRTMYIGADQYGPLITAADDCRITSIGKLLRQTKLDELPQLWNVIRGEMSFVGPRPQVPRFVQHFRADQLALILSVRPGITGPTQLAFRYEEHLLAGIAEREQFYIQTLLPIKCAMDVEYVRTRSVCYDLLLLVRTVGRCFPGRKDRPAFPPPSLETLAVVAERVHAEQNAHSA